MGSDVVTTEVYVRGSRAAVAAALAGPATLVDPDVQLTDGWQETAWTRSLTAWRRTGRWARGRTGGTVTVDLVPASAATTLLTVTLAVDRRRGARPPVAEASVVAVELRRRAEHGTTPATPPPAPDRTGVRTERPAGVVVGYSGP